MKPIKAGWPAGILERVDAMLDFAKLNNPMP